MKKLILSTLIACFAVFTVNAQDTKGPQIEFTKIVHDYGTIENGADGTCEFEFKNTGNEDLKITNCRASCGCTIPSWPREAIAKGETGIIKVKYDTKRTGPIHKTITITSTAVNAPSKLLTIKGTIKPPKSADASAATKKVVAPIVAKPVPVKTTPTVKPAAGKVAVEPEVVKTRKWYQFWKKK